MIYIISLWFAVFIAWFIHSYQRKKQLSSLIESEGEFEGVQGVKTVIDVDHFEASLRLKIKFFFKQLHNLLSPNITLKLIAFFGITATALYFINSFLLHADYMYCLMICEPVLFFVFVIKLQQRKAQKFQNDFPDALNILVGALSAGQSVVHAFEYVGKTLDNDVGQEFRYMAERLLIGEDADDVLSRSANSFPYVEYFFFASTIRLNLSRGGQLKEVISRINRIMFEARAMDKKKNALTSEARASAKIIGCLPLFFLLILRFSAPENYNFVMFEDAGKPLFYYVLISELIGFFCIWMILKGVE
ncbi:type II secretion system F family protein [Vibrio sp. JC009]|uniref:type II secretion system F family protein n=1 Tax=Vibrio sp. JC009 TaxID=2912314 RepID=UPI0023B07F70|nr:type II secretion system F family protein [Vibrio sp. JC009]WED24570.1 type II secretion system F family protein [Vibrio sp. JC009]